MRGRDNVVRLARWRAPATPLGGELKLRHAPINPPGMIEGHHQLLLGSHDVQRVMLKHVDERFQRQLERWRNDKRTSDQRLAVLASRKTSQNLSRRSQLNPSIDAVVGAAW